jgi:hypothetical protein
MVFFVQNENIESGNDVKIAKLSSAEVIARKLRRYTKVKNKHF